MSNRFLTLTSIVLLVVVVIEGYYLFFYKTSFYNRVYAPSVGHISVKPTSNSKRIQVNSRVLSYLSSYNKDILTSSIVTNEFQGKITKIMDQPGVFGSMKYEKGLVLNSNNDSNYILFRKNDIPIIDVLNANDVGINFTQLAVGDYVNINEKINLLASPDDNRISVEIQKQ